jgi:hypothetical protein
MKMILKFLIVDGEISRSGFLLKSQQTFYKIQVRFVNHTILAECTLAAFGFFGKNVTFERFLVCDLPRARYLEPFLGTGIRFNLWHFNYLFL